MRGLLFVSTDDDTALTALLAHALPDAGCSWANVVLPRLTTGGTRDEPTRHVERLRARAAELDAAPLVVGGFSFGARVALAAAGPLGAAGVVCFGFPFHRRGDPADDHGLRELRDAAIPTLVVQGERDAHGDRQRVGGMKLPDTVAVCWLPDGNHRFAPRQRSEVSLQQNLERATRAAADFILRR